MKVCVIMLLAANALLLLTESKSISPQQKKTTRTKRSSWGDPYRTEKRDELLNALNGLERAQKRFKPGNEYMNPMAYMFDGSSRGDEDSGYGAGYERADEEMRKKSYEPYKTYPRPANLAELEDILASPAKAKAKKAKWGNSDESDLDDAFLPEEDVSDVEESAEVKPARMQFTRQQLESLLEKAEEYQRLAVEKEKGKSVEVEPSGTVEPVSKEELENVLSGNEPKEAPESANEGEEQEDGDDGNDVDFGKFKPNMVDLNKEWLINQYLKAAGEEVSKKKKRGAKRREEEDESSEEPEIPPIDAEEEEEELEEEEAEDKYTKEDLEKMVEEYAIENKLISKENEYLATALNAATLGQIEKSDKYLGQQYKALQNAVKVEENLQDIESGGEGGGSTDKRVVKKSDTEEDLSDDMPVSELEKYPVEDEKGQWFDGPLPEGYDLIDEDSPEFRQLNPFLRKIIKIYGPEKAKEILTAKRTPPQPAIEVEEVDKPDEEEIEEAIAETLREKEAEEAEEEEEIEEEAEEEEEEEENEIAATLEGLISNMAPEKKVQLKEQIANIVGDPQDVCPAVETLADGCETLMNRYNIDLDDEARTVCARHRVCYACGSSIDARRLSRDSCDRLFLQEAERRCKGDDSCKEGASGLFFIMDREHSYIKVPSETTAEICNRKCVAKFILGFE